MASSQPHWGRFFCANEGNGSPSFTPHLSEGRHDPPVGQRRAHAHEHGKPQQRVPCCQVGQAVGPSEDAGGQQAAERYHGGGYGGQAQAFAADPPGG